MCDMDCGSDGGFDLGTDCEISEEVDIDVNDESSSFESLEDISDSCEENEEVADLFSDAETLSFEEYIEPEESDRLLTESDEFEEDTIVDLESLEDVDSKLTFTNEELQELSAEYSDNSEFEMRMQELIESGRIGVIETKGLEGTDENSDDTKVRTRDITPEVIESRERDTEEVLNNYRENLRERGVDDKSIESFVEQEREKIYAEYSSLDRGDTSSNIYYIPSDWDSVVETLGRDSDSEYDEVISDLGNEEKIDDEVSEGHSNRFILDYPEETVEYVEEESFEIPDLIDEEEIQEINEESTCEAEVPEEEMLQTSDVENEEEIPEQREDLVEDNLDIQTEVSELDVNYDEIYEEIANEQLEQGYKDIDIEADAEVLEQSLERFEGDVWNNLEIYEQREAINELSDYIKNVVGFENPPTIEYYHSAREGEYGGYDSATNTLHINEYMLYNSREAADTVAHELWHAHQQECASHPKSPRDYQYQYNFENYISPEYGFEQYQNQLVEAEARSFAAQFKNRIGNGKERTRQ